VHAGLSIGKIVNILLNDWQHCFKAREPRFLALQQQLSRHLPETTFMAVPDPPAVYESTRQWIVEQGFVPAAYIDRKAKEDVLLDLGISFVQRFIGYKRHSELKPTTPNDVPQMWADAVLDISDEGFGDRSGAPKTVWLRQLPFALRRNPLVFLPQAWGPFEKSGVRKYSLRLLNMADLICARDNVSLEYLKNLSTDLEPKLALAPDIAILLEGLDPKEGVRILREAGLETPAGPVVGLMPETRIHERARVPGDENAYLKKMEAVGGLFLEAGCSIAIMPGQIADRAQWNRTSPPAGVESEQTGRTDDRVLCSALAESLGRKGSVVALAGEYDAGQTKAVIANLDMLVGSGYNNIIAALSLGVPPLVLESSFEYDELLRMFNQQGLAVDLEKMETSAVLSAVEKTWQQRERISKEILQVLPDIQKSASSVVERTAEILLGSVSK